MISNEQLDQYRLEGTRVRVIRDSDPANDVKGYVMAWDDQFLLIKKLNRRVLKLDRTYQVQPWEAERASI
ncbi:hypothetical protein [Gorillibacterium sp. CAU 1737]|uniref:hypothetical protein n=1 Tax=Gorillibacterium sp. CAU 1737 TaxID=3140362 RepID=UPI00326042D6